MAYQITIRTLKRSGPECNPPPRTLLPPGCPEGQAQEAGAGVQASTAHDPQLGSPEQAGASQPFLLLGAWPVSSSKTVYRSLLLSFSILFREQRELMLEAKIIWYHVSARVCMGHFRTISLGVGDFRRCFLDMVRAGGCINGAGEQKYLHSKLPWWPVTLNWGG